MEIQQLLYVVIAAEHLSFSKAAKLACVTQSCLSQQIAKLENEMSLKIFDRTTRTVRLTNEGEIFVKNSRKVLEDIDILKTSSFLCSHTLKGTLHIGLIASIITSEFAKLITSFHLYHPQLKLDITQGGSLKLLNLLHIGEIDVAFVTKALKGNFDNIEFINLSELNYFLAVPKEHPLSHKTVVNLSELKNEKFIFHTASLAMYDICMDACHKEGFDPNIVCVSNSAIARYKMIEAGDGIGFFPYEDFMSFNVNRIIRLKIKPPIQAQLAFAISKRLISTPICNAFYNYVNNWISVSELHNTLESNISTIQADSAELC